MVLGSGWFVLGFVVIVFGSDEIRVRKGGNGVVKRCNCVLNGGNERGGFCIRLLQTRVWLEQLQKII